MDDIYRLIKIDDGDDIVIDTRTRSTFKTYFIVNDFVEYMSRREEEWEETHSELWDRISELETQVANLKSDCGDKRLKEISDLIEKRIVLLRGEPATLGEYNAYKDLKQYLKDLKLWRD